MEKMTETEALCEAVVLELIEVKMHICNGRHFEGGVGLGGLINSLLYRKDQEEDKRKDEEVQDEDEDEECEEGSEEEDFKTMYIEKCEEYLENKEILIEFREENKQIHKQLKEAYNLLKDLYNNDHIFPQQREAIRQFLLSTDEFVDGCLGRITTK